MEVILNDDGSFTVEWDENDPIESQLNDWTEDEWHKALQDMFEKSAEEWEFDDEL